MHNREKHPETFAQMEALQAELAPLMAKRKDHTNKIDELRNAQMAAYQASQEEIEAINALAMADIDKIRDLRRKINRCANAMR